MSRTSNQKRAENLAEYLNGTCDNLDDHLKPGEIENTEMLEELDQLVFRCDGCSWWFDVEDMSEESHVCKECHDV